MNLFEKARAWPESKKRLLFWGIILLLSAVLLFFWIKRAERKLEKLRGIKFPKIDMERFQHIEKKSK